MPSTRRRRATVRLHARYVASASTRLVDCRSDSFAEVDMFSARLMPATAALSSSSSFCCSNFNVAFFQILDCRPMPLRQVFVTCRNNGCGAVDNGPYVFCTVSQNERRHFSDNLKKRRSVLIISDRFVTLPIN